MLSLITLFADYTSRGRRWNWRTELEDVKHVEQEEEQHEKQGQAEDNGGDGEVMDTVFTLLAEEDCHISSSGS